MSNNEGEKPASASEEMQTILAQAMDVAAERDMDGFRLLEFTAEGVFLTIAPPQGSGQPMPFENIKNEIKEKDIVDVNWVAVKRAIENMSSLPLFIAPPQEEVKEDGAVKAEIGRDKMQAFLTVYPPRGGAPATMEMARDALQKAGVVFGIREDLINKALELSSVSEPVVVAEGRPLENGADARIEFLFARDGQIKPQELADGRVDYYNLNMIQNVEEGQVLATKTPATPGVPGMTVLGAELPVKPGKDQALAAGKNTELVDNGTTLIATASGHVVVQGNKISVSPVLEVKGNVDFSSGNINFVGSVIIRGSVMEGFTVKAEGDIEINDSIFGASVFSSSNVKVKNGIQGRHKGRIVAAGNIYCKFIENAEVHAGGDVVVGEAIMHSTVTAKHSVMVSGKKGLIVGGSVHAGDEINAKLAGSNFATPTKLEAGISPELREEYNEVNVSLSLMISGLEKSEKALALLRNMEAQGVLDNEKKAMLIKLTRSKVQMLQEKEKLKARKEELEITLEQMERGRIKVSGLIHPGVTVTIGRVTMQVRDDIQFATLTRDGADIRVSSYE